MTTNPITAVVRRQPIDVQIENLTYDRSLALVKTKPELSAQLIMALIAQNTSALPGTAFVKRSDGQMMKRHVAAITLRESEGHLVPIKKRVKVGDSYESIIHYDYSIAGLRRINELGAIQIIRPERVMVGGVAQMNPYIEVDAESRMPQVVYARTLAVGYSPVGSLVATDSMVRLDINIYLLENLQAKMNELGDNAGRLGVYGVKSIPPVDPAAPADSDSTDEKSRKDRARALKPTCWVFMPLHSVGGIGVWVNLSAPEFQRVISDHTTRLKFIERLAQTFAERNALKAHPGVPKTLNAVNGVATVRVYGWTTDIGRGEIEKLRELIEKDQLDKFTDADGNPMDVMAVEAVIDEETTQVLNQDAESDGGGDAPAGDKTEAPAPKVSPDDLLPRANDLCSALITAFGRPATKKNLKDAGITVIEEATQEQMEVFIRAGDAKLRAAEGKSDKKETEPPCAS